MIEQLLETVTTTLGTLKIADVSVMELVQAVVGFIGAASILGAVVARFTKTKKDDAFWAKVRDLLLKLSLNVTKK